MIKEIEVAQLVTYLAKETNEESITCYFSQLQKIGNYIEQHNQEIRVELGERYFRSFRSRCVQHIILDGESIIMEGINTPIVQSLISQYAPKDEVASLIKQALEEEML